MAPSQAGRVILPHYIPGHFIHARFYLESRLKVQAQRLKLSSLVALRFNRAHFFL